MRDRLKRRRGRFRYTTPARRDRRRLRTPLRDAAHRDAPPRRRAASAGSCRARASAGARPPARSRSAASSARRPNTPAPAGRCSPWQHDHVRQVRAESAAAGLGVDAARLPPAPIASALPPRAPAPRPATPRATPRVLDQDGRGSRPTTRRARSAELGRRLPARRGDGDAVRRHRLFQRAEPGRIGLLLAQQRRALLHRPLVGGDTRRVRRVDAPHQAIEKPPSRRKVRRRTADPFPASARSGRRLAPAPSGRAPLARRC